MLIDNEPQNLVQLQWTQMPDGSGSHVKTGFGFTTFCPIIVLLNMYRDKTASRHLKLNT